MLRIALSAIFFLIAVHLTGCTDPEPLKIGFLGGVSGRAADVDRAGRNGVQLAVETINRQGGVHGRTVQLIVYDDQQDLEMAAQGVEQLAEAGVAAIVGGMTSNISFAVKPVADRHQVVLISPTTATGQLSNQDDYFFRIFPTCETSARALASYAVQKLGAKRFAVVRNQANGTFTEGWQHCFTSQLEALSGEVARTIVYNAQDREFRFLDIARQLSEVSVNGILILANAMDTALLAQQLHKLGNTVPLFGSDWSYSGALVEYGGKAVDGLIFTTSLNLASDDVEYRAFCIRYQERFGQFPKFPAVLAYEAAGTVFQALEHDPDPDRLHETLAGFGPVKGLQEPFSLDGSGDVVRATFINKVEGGRFVNLDKHGP